MQTNGIMHQKQGMEKQSNMRFGWSNIPKNTNAVHGHKNVQGLFHLSPCIAFVGLILKFVVEYRCPNTYKFEEAIIDHLKGGMRSRNTPSVKRFEITL